MRAPGFPATTVFELAAPDAAAAADAVCAFDDETAALRERVIAALRAIDVELSPGARKVADVLTHRRPHREERDLEVMIPALGALRQRDRLRQEQVAHLERAYGAALVQTGDAVHAVASDPRFREAVLWQNRQAVRTGLDSLLAHRGQANASIRKKQRMVGSYLQRYCLKNDTIGFFGPIAWGELTSSERVEVRAGRDLLRQRAVHFEHWAIDALANTIESWEDVRPFLAPRLVASAAITGTRLQYGIDRSTVLPAVVASLLAACDGETPACVIARALVADAAVDLGHDSEVYELMQQLVDRKILVWRLEPAALVDPEHALRRLLLKIETPDIRARALAVLDRLEASRDRVAASAGDPPRLEAALDELASTFEEVTGLAATRRGGETYAARTPVYEDCVRDLTASIGQPVIGRLGPVFALVAQSARWFTHELATRYRTVLRDSYRELTQASPGEPVRYVRFLSAIQHLLPHFAQLTTEGVIGAEVGNELDRRWGSILGLDMSQPRVTLTVAEIAEPAMHAFAAPAPGWPGACHICPDVMIAARSADHVSRGDFTLVLGEVHIGNTLFVRGIAPHGPDEDDVLARAYELDIPVQRVIPVAPSDQVTRAQNLPWSSRELDLELATTKSWRPREHVLRAADLVVEAAGDSLVVRDVRDNRKFDVIAMLEGYFVVMVGNHFKPAPRGPHVPRVTIDGVVLCRERWSLPRDGIGTFPTETRGAELFVKVRAWVRALGFPRWVFVKVPEEPKPVYVDFASPLYVELFAKLVRKASSVSVTEMLPTVDEAWIPDAEGRLYTSELRMVAVDPATRTGTAR